MTRIPGLCYAIKCPDPLRKTFPTQTQWVHLEREVYFG
jgi:hypothetical protein